MVNAVGCCVKVWRTISRKVEDVISFKAKLDNSIPWIHGSFGTFTMLFLKGQNTNTSIGIPPAEVMWANQTTVSKRLYGRKGYKKSCKLSPGDRLRLSKARRTLKKGYLPNWTEELLTVVKCIETRPLVYLVKDAHGEILEGTFYTEEIQKVIKQDDVYKIQSALKNRRKGRRVQYLIKWLEYPVSFNSWIFKEDLQKRGVAV